MAASWQTKPDGGFLIVKRFDRLYSEFKKPWGGGESFYGVPRVGFTAGEVTKQYRGIDREPLWPFSDKDVENLGDTVAPRIEDSAQRRLAALDEDGFVRQDFLSRLIDAEEVLQLVTDKASHELIWARNVEAALTAPTGWITLGYEPTWFGGDHFSPLCDCFFFPRWHGPDTGGILFKEHFESLNVNGLFETGEQARDYVTRYELQDWTETGPYVIAEVKAPK
jgi:hypothetical protein